MKRRDVFKHGAAAAALAATGVVETKAAQAAEAAPRTVAQLGAATAADLGDFKPKSLPAGKKNSWRLKHNPYKNEYAKRGKRAPAKVTDINQIPPEERLVFTWMNGRNDEFAKGSLAFAGGDKFWLIDGDPYGAVFYPAMAWISPLAVWQARWGRVVTDIEREGKSVNGYYHLFIDQLIPMDSGYYDLIGGGMMGGSMANGWRIDLFEAMRDHRDDLMLPEELATVNFLRATRDGKMTAEIWDGMTRVHKGNKRAVVDQAMWMLQLGQHHMFCHAIGNPEHTREQMTRLIEEVRTGKRKYPRQVEPLNMTSKVAVNSPLPKGVDPECPPWNSWGYAEAQVYPQRAAWFPQPGQSTVFREKNTLNVAWNETSDYEYLMRKAADAKANVKEMVAGQPYWVDHYTALAASPRMNSVLARLEDACYDRAGKTGSYSVMQNHLISMVLPLDSGYFAFLPTETGKALKAGVRPEVLQALHDHNDKGLTDAEKLDIQFIRAVRDEAVTDELWDRVEKKMGSKRAVMEFAYAVASRHVSHMIAWAYGVPDMAHPDFDKMLADYKSGARKA